MLANGRVGLAASQATNAGLSRTFGPAPWNAGTMRGSPKIGTSARPPNALRKSASCAGSVWYGTSIRFGLAAAEALWKRTPVIAVPGGGLDRQVEDARSGYLVDDTASMARRLEELVQDPGLAIELGTAGRRRVQENFLVTRLLEDELHLMADATVSR